MSSLLCSQGEVSTFQAHHTREIGVKGGQEVHSFKGFGSIMSFPSNYPDTGLFIHKSSVSDINLSIQSNASEVRTSFIKYRSVCLWGGESWQNISAEDQQRSDAQWHMYTSNVPPRTWHVFPGRESTIQTRSGSTWSNWDSFIGCVLLCDRRNRGGTSPNWRHTCGS